jgi:lipoprotein-anchoring transpeptidase ErfK/SrfK
MLMMRTILQPPPQSLDMKDPTSRLSSALLAIPAVSVLLLAGCAAPRDTAHQVVVSVEDQRMAVIKNGQMTAVYPVSTSKFGLGSRTGSYATPIGRLVVAKKIGTGAPSGAVFHSRRRTGEVLRPNAPGRDPIVSRILWLDGKTPENGNSYARCIYIHGTTEERKIGTPASYGCIRMKSKDVIDLYARVGIGAQVDIIRQPLRSAVAMLRSVDSPGAARTPSPAPAPTPSQPTVAVQEVRARRIDESNASVATPDAAFADGGRDTVHIGGIGL